ncbi:uncharacterized protein LOC134178496 [Corticium candelabrum]|uniref:uncharacterized protein LOC134178496 n=1 Tax=Corticium candelabrum TaxID=121492 RepID=UPI002E257744|nr:uncharacterized protein LOC134178496 [Corticium candelabrum]
MDGSIRICGDFRLTINQAAPCEKYPLPKINDIFASLAGGQLFTKLDLSQAYQQVALDETSQKSLAEAESRYAQIDREALASLFSVKKFHQYLSGRAFTILTDHKPLVWWLGENKGVPLMASGRMKRWAIMLSDY